MFHLYLLYLLLTAHLIQIKKAQFVLLIRAYRTKGLTCVCVKNGDKWDCTLVEAPGNTPPSLDDAIAKADNVKPDLKGGNENGNNTKPPKDLGGFNINESGLGSNDVSEDAGGLEFGGNTTKPELQ
jgi:hypothetical protein